MHTITLIEGDAFGGGFELSFSYNSVFAEEQCKFGFQQTRYNILPRTSIYSFVARWVGIKNAEKIFLSNNIYTASETHKMGAFTQVAKKGEGYDMVIDYMVQYKKSFLSRQTLLDAKLVYQPLDYVKLEEMGKIWIETMMNLEESDLKKLRKIADAQEKSKMEIEKSFAPNKIAGSITLIWSFLSFANILIQEVNKNYLCFLGYS